MGEAVEEREVDGGSGVGCREEDVNVRERGKGGRGGDVGGGPPK